MPAKICTVKRPSCFTTLNASYYSSFMKLLMLFMHLTCVFEYLGLSWPHAFWTKMNRINKREFSDASKKTSPISNPHTLNSNILNRQGRKLHQFVQKMGEKKKNKSTTCCKVLKCYALTRKRKNSQRLLKLKSIPCALSEILEATIPEFKEK